jgi:hypothetical protein
MTANTQRSRKSTASISSPADQHRHAGPQTGRGFLTGSLVMIADGMDSSLDAIANTIAMW